MEAFSCHVLVHLLALKGLGMIGFGLVLVGVVLAAFSFVFGHILSQKRESKTRDFLRKSPRFGRELFALDAVLTRAKREISRVWYFVLDASLKRGNLAFGGRVLFVLDARISRQRLASFCWFFAF